MFPGAPGGPPGGAPFDFSALQDALNVGSGLGPASAQGGTTGRLGRAGRCGGASAEPRRLATVPRAEPPDQADGRANCQRPVLQGHCEADAGELRRNDGRDAPRRDAPRDASWRRPSWGWRSPRCAQTAANLLVRCISRCRGYGLRHKQPKEAAMTARVLQPRGLLRALLALKQASRPSQVRDLTCGIIPLLAGMPGMPGMPGPGGMPGMPGMPPGMMPPNFDPSKYMEAMQNMFANPSFMQMAEQLGKTIMQVRRSAAAPDAGAYRSRLGLPCG
jgi:hypothetical protein